MTDPTRPVAIEDLLAHADWLRALARKLVAGDDVASDVEQETWLAALENPPRDAAAPRKWLAQVLRNIVKQRRRSESARSAREKSVARPEAIASGTESIDRAQSLRALIDSVLELEEPYGSTLLLHYQEGLSHDEIARQQCVASSTVRNRIARGLAQLRERLHRRHGDAWSAILIPLIPHKAAVGVALGSTAVTITTMSSLKLVSAVAALLVVGAALWWKLPELGPTVPVAGAARPTAVTVPELDQPLTDPQIGRAVAMDSKPIASPPPPAPIRARGALDVTVLWESDGTPAADVVVRVLAWGESSAFAFTTSQTTDGEGRTRFDGVASGSVVVAPDRAEGDQVEVRGGETTALTLKIPLGIFVRGRVVDESGAPVGGARIWLSQYGNGGEGEDVSTADAAGRFVLRDVGEARRIAARAAGFAPSASMRVAGKPGDTVEVTIEMPPNGGVLRGVVHAPDGAPVARAMLQLGSEHVGMRPLRSGGEGYSPPPFRLVTDESGAFAFSGVAVGRTQLQCRAGDFAPWSQGIEILAEMPTEIDVELQPGAAVTGSVRGADGAPASAVQIGIGPYADFASSNTRTGADGSFFLDGLVPGETAIRFSARERGDAQASVKLIAGEVARLDVQLVKGGFVAGRVIDEQGAPLVGWLVGAVTSDHPGLHLRSSTSDKDGKFTLDNWPPKANALEVRKKGAWAGPPALLVKEVEVGRNDYVLTVPMAAQSKGLIVGRLLGPNGEVVQDAMITWSARGSNQGFYAELSTDTGEFKAEVPPGDYGLTAQSPNLGTIRVPERSIGPGETLNVGVLRFAAPGRVRVKLIAGKGMSSEAELSNVYVNLEDPGRMGSGQIVLDANFEGLSQPLSPGSYKIQVYGTNMRAPPTNVEVIAGEEHLVEITLEPAASRSLAVNWAPGAPPKDPFEFSVTTAEGALFLKGSYPAHGDGASYIGLDGLAVGTYLIDVKTTDGRSGRASFTVDDLEPMSPQLAARNRIQVQVK